MGQDLSVLFVPRAVDFEMIETTARHALGDQHPDDVHIHIVDEKSGPKLLAPLFERYTALSLWSDEGFDLIWDPVAHALSEKVEARLLGIMMSDHGGSGGWQAIENGKPGETGGSTEDYLHCIGDGFRQTYDVAIARDEVLWFPESLATGAERGICLFSSDPALSEGTALDANAIERSLSHFDSGLLELADPSRPTFMFPHGLLATFVDRYNDGIAAGRFDTLVALFLEDAVLEYEGVARGPFRGASRIQQAFRDFPPTEPITIFESSDDRLVEEGSTASAPFSAKSKPWKVLGSIHVDAFHGRIRRLVISVRPS